MDSALKVNHGVQQPPEINPRAREIIKKKPGKSLAVPVYLEGIRKGDVSILAQSITLIESTLEEDRKKARELV
ncbi:MAG TPA: methylmalonyl Co-A mutase-associated GTPase MeaB, partial [Rikenellaceae bacterium]|nr:methylmalonyl Co-A mutase-associated GTPase MeaB [Rikenellaceae bacterium]